MSLDGAPAVNIYRKFTYNGVEYTLDNDTAFAFCRGVGCGNKTRIGVSNFSNSTLQPNTVIRYNERKFDYGSGTWIEDTYSPPNASTYALIPANAELQVLLGSTTVFNMEWLS